MNEKKIALLIDGDNSSYQRVNEILEEVTKYGVVTIRRIYGDFTSPNLEGWKKQLLENAISPIQQFAYTTGKNATDSSLIIDAMDILYSDQVDAFCIVSSDSDFTRLVTRLRETGKMVIGMGEEKTPTPFIKACDRFIYLSVIKQSVKAKQVSAKVKSQLINMIDLALNDAEDEGGFANLGEVGSIINKRHPEFDPRNYGFSKLSLLVASLPVYEIDKRQAPNSNTKHVYIQRKKKK